MKTLITKDRLVEIIRNNWRLKLLSLLAAIVVWLSMFLTGKTTSETDLERDMESYSHAKPSEDDR